MGAGKPGTLKVQLQNLIQRLEEFCLQSGLKPDPDLTLPPKLITVPELSDLKGLTNVHAIPRRPTMIKCALSTDFRESQSLGQCQLLGH